MSKVGTDNTLHIPPVAMSTALWLGRERLFPSPCTDDAERDAGRDAEQR